MVNENKTSLSKVEGKLAAETDGQSGLALIAKERARQVFIERYTSEHDDEHDLGELALAAALFALPYDAKVGNEPLLKQDDYVGLHIALEVGCNFIVKPDFDNMRRLIKAGALIVAEIERIQRTKSSEASHSPNDTVESSVLHLTDSESATARRKNK